MPRVLLEAMALKTPILASDVDGNPELIENEVNGWLFPIEKPEVIVDAIEQAASSKELRVQFAERAYEKYWNHFSRSHLVDRYLSYVAMVAQKYGLSRTTG